MSTVDNTGNELAGIRLPAIAVPAAAYTGWNPRVHVEGLPDVLYEFTGSKLPLQSGAVPADRAAYEAEVASAAAALVRDRLLLAEDAPRAVAEAMGIYDEAVGRERA